MTRILAHLGYIKSGSSSLQNHLFAQHPQLNYLATQLAEDTPRTPFQAAPLTTRFYRALIEDGAPGDLQDLWRTHVAPALDPRRTNILSDETALTVGDPRTVLTRVADIAPTARILIVTRNQTDLLRSFYDMFPTIRHDESGRGSYADFDGWLDHILDQRGHYDLARNLHYATTIRMAQDIFGTDNVHVIPFEQLFRSETAQAALARCLGIAAEDVSAALARPAVNDHREHAAKKLTRRLLGPVHASWFLPQPVLKRINRALGRVVRSGPTRITEAQRHRIVSHYAEDTAAMQAIMAGLPR